MTCLQVPIAVPGLPWWLRWLSVLSTVRETWVRSLGWEDSLEKEMTTHSSTLAWKIPRTEELGAGQCPWGRKELGTTERLHFHGGPQSGSDLTLMLRGQLFTWGAWVLGMGRATVGAVCSQ